jgi:hypothetical protein
LKLPFVLSAALAALVIAAPAVAHASSILTVDHAYYYNYVTAGPYNSPYNSQDQTQVSAGATPGFHVSGSGSSAYGPSSWSSSTVNDYAHPSISSSTSTRPGASASAESDLVYYFAVMGAPGNVSVNIQASGHLSWLGEGRGIANLFIQPAAGGVYFVNETLNSMYGQSLFSLNQAYNLTTGTVYAVTMQTLAGSNDEGTASAAVDPQFFVPTGYSIVTSPGIGNGVAVAPIPAALPLFASALGVLGVLGRRRKKATIAAE